MSLLSDAMTNFKVVNKVTASDGYGGTTTTWQEGSQISGAMVFNSSHEARTAQAMGVTSVYTFTTAKSVSLNYHGVLKRVSDGKIFRITSDGDDLFTPSSAGIDMRQVTAEEWRLPS